jgi:urease accessory protein
LTGADVHAGTAQTTGWQACLELGLEKRGLRTVAAHRRREGPLAVQRPFYPEGDVCHLYLLHPPGGVVGGDTLDIRVRAGSGSRALVTTPGATKFYRSAGATAVVTQTLQVGAGAVLEWLPQEAILFQGAVARQQTRVELDPGACFAGWDILCLGRPSNAEPFAPGRLDISLEVWRDGAPVLIDRLRVDDGGDLGGAAGLRGHPVSATLLATPASADNVQQLRDLAVAGRAEIGVTLLEDLLAARLLADDTAAAKAVLHSAWRMLRPGYAGRPAIPPRIWAT